VTATDLDPQAAEQLKLIATFIAGGADADIDAQRLTLKSILTQLTDDHSHHFDGVIEDRVVRDANTAVPVRRYTPSNAIPAAGIVYFHGGGWVFGDLDTGERFARALARTLKMTVVSVEYRRAPEHPYPAALIDCLAVADRARKDFANWCAVAGDSAGGNLAAAVALARVNSDHGFDVQLLLYPCIDASMREASYDAHADGYGLTREAMEYYWNAYAGGSPRNDPLLSPHAADSLQGLPPTVIAAAGFDVLLDEGARFVERLIASSIRATYLLFPTLPHGFIDLVDRVDAARDAVDEVLAALKAFVPASVAEYDSAPSRQSSKR
jgi:acetyl esterase